MGATISDAAYNVEETVWSDLSEVLGCKEVEDLAVTLHLDETSGYADPMQGSWIKLEDYVDVESIEFNHYNESPDILDVVVSDNRPKRFKSHSLRSNCRVTNQPDWGDIYIHTKGIREVTPESLMQYIVSMRKENHFHEEICECVYKRLDELLEPEELIVACLYTRRGGIDINPIRASSNILLYGNPIWNSTVMTAKTMRQ